jgi:hypothetical protein
MIQDPHATAHLDDRLSRRTQLRRGGLAGLLAAVTLLNGAAG